VPIPLVYLHGLESGPMAGKANALRACGLFDVHAPALDSSATQAALQRDPADVAALSQSLDVPVQQACAAIASHQPEVVVASSFGGAVLARALLAGGVPTGTSLVLLASAHESLAGIRSLPSGYPTLIVHGRHDDVVPLQHACSLASHTQGAVLVELDDNHRLQRMTASGLLVQLTSLAQGLRATLR
jgi:pimeloyl-ACP methyl ester carboxylesterase